MNDVQNKEHCSFMEFPMFQLQSPTLEAIRNTRLGLGLSIAEAAGLVYATPRAWSHWETGARQMDPARFHLLINRLTTPSDAALASLGLSSRPSDTTSPRELIVILVDLDGVQQPIDVVARDNFVACEIESDGIHATISSLAVDWNSKKPYVHRTKFKRESNQHVEAAVQRWVEKRLATATPA